MYQRGQKGPVTRGKGVFIFRWGLEDMEKNEHVGKNWVGLFIVTCAIPISRI